MFGVKQEKSLSPSSYFPFFNCFFKSARRMISQVGAAREKSEINAGKMALERMEHFGLFLQ